MSGLDILAGVIVYAFTFWGLLPGFIAYPNKGYRESVEIAHLLLGMLLVFVAILWAVIHVLSGAGHFIPGRRKLCNLQN